MINLVIFHGLCHFMGVEAKERNLNKFQLVFIKKTEKINKTHPRTHIHVPKHGCIQTFLNQIREHACVNIPVCYSMKKYSLCSSWNTVVLGSYGHVFPTHVPTQQLLIKNLNSLTHSLNTPVFSSRI